MSGWQTIDYVLRHLWLWPLQFWLRPLNVSERSFQTDQISAEFWCSVFGSALWGALLGIGVWQWKGEIQAIWQLALSFGFIIFSASYSTSSIFDKEKFIKDYLDENLGDNVFECIANISYIHINKKAKKQEDGLGFGATFMLLLFFFVNVKLIPKEAVYVGLTILFGIMISCFFVLNFIALTYDNNSFNTRRFGYTCISLIIGFYFPTVLSLLQNHIGLTISIFLLLLLFGKIIRTKLKSMWNMILLTFTLNAYFTFFPQIMVFSNLDVILPFSLIIGIQTYFYYSRDGLIRAFKKTDLRWIARAYSNWIFIFYLLFTLFALAVWKSNSENLAFNAMQDKLALFFLLTPPIATGLPLWPLLILLATQQFNRNRAINYNPQYFASSLPFQWQTFAYPLPGLRHYLVALGRKQSVDSAFCAIQSVQLRSMQMHAARLAAVDLAAAPDTALGFCGHVAVTCNNATLLPLATTGSLARTLAVLAKPTDKEMKQPLRLYVADYPPPALKPKRWNFSLAAAPKADWNEEFERIRADNLFKRIGYAKQLLADFPSAIDSSEFSALLQTLSAYADEDFRNVQNLPPVQQVKDHAPWLSQGWAILAKLETLLQPLAIYRELATPSARCELLESKSTELQSVTWEGVSEYWTSIGQELLALWVDKLQQGAHSAREWLRLEAYLINDQLGLGVQTLQLQVRNPTGLLARNVRFQVQATKGLDWHHNEAKQPLLEGGTTAIIRLELEANQTGSFRIAGQLQADDVSGNAYSLPLVFQIHVAEAGHPYRLLAYQPYVTGEGLGDERTFVGRHELLHWLRGLWLQPQGKPAVALVGQRRMGKTSLLNKIRRDGLPDTGLLPVLANIQGISGDYDFLHSVARDMAAQLAVPQAVLQRDNPYPDFKDFLLGLTKPLQGRRFVLLLDEADLIPQRHFSDLLPGFLRALMQEPQYPTLLLFCGTHRLKDMSRDYASILFNTVQFRPVSYMTEAESAEVLTKPPGDALDFDPAVLAEAYRLTLGQPLLLQSLGAALIDCCNGVVLNGGERSNYINLNDLNLAAETLVQQGNAAFEQYWLDADANTHRLLAALAWATDESNRSQLDLAGIEAVLAQLGLTLPEGAAFKIVERLCDEELLRRKGPTYHYAVPLYRRWVAWRWPPERVREE